VLLIRSGHYFAGTHLSQAEIHEKSLTAGLFLLGLAAWKLSFYFFGLENKERGA
jgi:hypothetical protein